VINARQAMPEGGSIAISCENIADAAEETVLSLPHGKYIKITIADNGYGIPEKYLDKIFDPYFTTKQEGSGLGLALTHSIITKHEGHIAVRSKMAEGTAFTIYLPASTQQISGDSEEETQKPENAVSATILVMDDEQLIQDVAEQMLSRFGHKVLQAKDGKEAIAIFKEHQHSDNPVDVIIMDLTIPGGMGGKDAIQKILKIDPDARAIVSSGYANDSVMANYRKYGFKAAIGKPFKMAELKKTVNSVLG
jgi:CheY-like chemotaxis protein